LLRKTMIFKKTC